MNKEKTLESAEKVSKSLSKMTPLKNQKV